MGHSVLSVHDHDRTLSQKRGWGVPEEQYLKPSGLQTHVTNMYTCASAHTHTPHTVKDRREITEQRRMDGREKEMWESTYKAVPGL